MAALLTRKLNHKITHVKITEDELAASMSAFIPPDYARVLARLDTAIKNGEEERINDVVEKITGRKPKSLEAFVDECVERGVWDRKQNE